MNQANLSTAAQEAATDIILTIDLDVQAQKGPDLRKDHPTSHSLVWGEFKVEDNIPEALQPGIIAKARRSNIRHRIEGPQAYSSILDHPQ